MPRAGAKRGAAVPLEPDDEAYARLLAVRTGLRRFEWWSAEQAAGLDLTPSQHQLLLAVRGHREDGVPGPTIRQTADYLLIRHHSAVELVDRCERADLVQRVRDGEDRRVVRLRLTPSGARKLARLSTVHLEELARLTALFESMLDTLEDS